MHGGWCEAEKDNGGSPRWDDKTLLFEEEEALLYVMIIL